MKVYTFEAPLEGRREGDFRLIDSPVPLAFLPFILGRGNYSLLEHMAGKYFKYYQSTLKDERPVIDLFVPNIKSIDEKSLKGAISDTIYQTKMTETDVLDAVSSLNFTINAGHWWLKYGLPLMILTFTLLAGYAFGTWVDILLALYLFKGREIFVVKSLEKQYQDYDKKVKAGIRKTFKNIENIRQIEHPGLRKLKEGIETAANKTEGYIWALHTAGKLGFPELRTFYSWNSAIDEWEYEEIGRTFDVFEKPPVECKREFRKTTYQPTGVKPELVEIIFHKDDSKDE